MKVLFSFIITVLFFGSSLGDSSCTIEDIDLDDFWFIYTNKIISDTHKKDHEIFKKKAEGISDLQINHYYSKNYFQASLDDGYLVIKTTEDFEHFEEYETHYSESDFEFDLELQFKCNNERKYFEMYQPVEDTNNHAPRFNRKVYKYKFGMPIRKGADLTDLVEILAVDIDITNTEVEFSIDGNSEEFEIANKRVYNTDDKVHWASLKTKKDITSEKSFQIVVKDKGNPPKDGKAEVIVEIV